MPIKYRRSFARIVLLAVLSVIAVPSAVPQPAHAEEVLGTLKDTISVSGTIVNTMVADWDSDGQNEIIALVARGDPTAPNGYIAAYGFDGTEYVREFKLSAPTKWPTTLDVGDVNGDGKNDIVMGTGNGDNGGFVYLISGGSIVWTSPRIQSIRFPTELCVGDTDEDGVAEIGLAVTWYGRYLTLYDHIGGNTFSEVFRLHEGDGHSCDIGDIDGDGKNELVYGMGSWRGRVKAFKFNGTGYRRLWDVNVFYPHRAYIDLGDTDSDGVAEIVVTSGEGSNPRTAVMEGSDVDWMGGPYGDRPGTRRAPTLGSWLNNGRIQIAFVAGHDSAGIFHWVVHFVEYDGTTYQNIGVLDRDNTVRTLIRPFIGDSDNDGSNELVLPELRPDNNSQISVYTSNRPPDCSAAGSSLDTLWPPNHRFVAIDVLSVTDPEGDPITITIDSIFQDEPVGKGRHSPDGRGVGSSTAEVRAERDGKGNGRVYHIGFTAEDGHGGSCSSEVLVGVPHDQGRGRVPVDGGALYDSTVAP